MCVACGVHGVGGIGNGNRTRNWPSLSRAFLFWMRRLRFFRITGVPIAIYIIEIVARNAKNVASSILVLDPWACLWVANYSDVSSMLARQQIEPVVTRPR